MRRDRPIGYALLAILAVIAAGLSACSSGTDEPAAGKPAPSSAVDSPTTTTPPPEPVTVTANPRNGARSVNPIDPITVSTQNGTLRTVTLTNPAGDPVSGTYGAGRRSWRTTEVLGYGKTYTWSGTAIGADDTTVPVRGRFTTIDPATTRATINIGDGRTVGIAAPIIISFAGHVSDRAAVERRLAVHSSTPTAGAWAWLPDDATGSRVHWRPTHYWKAGTTVSVSAKLYGVPYGGGSYGREDLTSDFSIGRAQITKADVNSFRLIVVRDGRQVMNFPASYGKADDPERNTRNGIHVVTEKFPLKLMSNPRYGYTNFPAKYAVRISNNGEFIHGNPDTVGIQGSGNVTHGCVNLSIENAHKYYESALYGDPVEVVNSPVGMTANDGDIYDWAIPWAEWQGLSAL
ncbi:MAG TPA: Ig-like domain-containing protein [Mycobacteriales bacterium]|nr:Ig-like domain-containing protein [Mycobacteriales bacterium]